MAESTLPTGNRDDVRIEASRCLRMRFCASGCRRCADICPHEAVSLDGGFALDADRCRGCLLCTTVCPSGALEHNFDFSACLAQLSRVPEPVLGCLRTKERSHASLPCLGGLSEEHLLTLCRSLPGKLAINLSSCAGCPNSGMIPYLQQRVAVLAEAGLLEEGCALALVKSVAELRFNDEAIGRRGFFKSLRTSLFQSAAVIVSGSTEQSELRTAYAGKRLPQRRMLLNGIRENCSDQLEARIRKRFDFEISSDENCTACHGCVAICPSGALIADHPESPPVFDQSLCSGCGLCAEFCLDTCVRISVADGSR